ncbi:MAG: S1-like domain-containing RNA-binding protein [Bdellovibrionota bacterium]
MVEIGDYNTLEIIREVDFGVYLDGQEDGEILLPLKYVPEDAKVGDKIEVFICYDSEDRLVATTEKPKAKLGEFAVLKVVEVTQVGAFLDWGLPKDLFLPFAEQTQPLRPGQEVIVFIYLDSTDRIAASMKLEHNLEKTGGDFEEGQEVDLLITGKTDLGYKAIVDGSHWGVLYDNEVFKPLRTGLKTKGFVKKLRPDGKLDLILQQAGHTAAVDNIAPKILAMLKQKGGYLAINDKTSAEMIHDLFGVSKKKYKIALGGLYKQRLITVDEDGIRLIQP